MRSGAWASAGRQRKAKGAANQHNRQRGKRQACCPQLQEHRAAGRRPKQMLSGMVKIVGGLAASCRLPRPLASPLLAQRLLPAAAAASAPAPPRCAAAPEPRTAAQTPPGRCGAVAAAVSQNGWRHRSHSRRPPQPANAAGQRTPEAGLHHILDKRQLALRHRRAAAVADERHRQPQSRLLVACTRGSKPVGSAPHDRHAQAGGLPSVVCLRRYPPTPSELKQMPAAWRQRHGTHPVQKTPRAPCAPTGSRSAAGGPGWRCRPRAPAAAAGGQGWAGRASGQVGRAGGRTRAGAAVRHSAHTVCVPAARPARALFPPLPTCSATARLSGPQVPRSGPHSRRLAVNSSSASWCRAMSVDRITRITRRRTHRKSSPLSLHQARDVAAPARVGGSASTTGCRAARRWRTRLAAAAALRMPPATRPALRQTRALPPCTQHAPRQKVILLLGQQLEAGRGVHVLVDRLVIVRHRRLRQRGQKARDVKCGAAAAANGSRARAERRAPRRAAPPAGAPLTACV